MANPDASASAPPEHEEGDLDTEQLKELAGFVLRGPRRRPLLATLAFSVTFALGVLIAAFWPRSYESSMRILAQRNLVLPSALPRDADSPTKNAADTILKRDNLVALLKQLDIVDRWQATRQPILRVKDQIYLSLFGPKSEEDRLLDLIGVLEKRLAVKTDESSINVSIEWPDRQMAFDIIALVQKNFLEARYDSNVRVIEEAIRILEERAKPQSKEVDAALEEMSRLQAQRRASLAAAPAGVPAQSSGVRPSSSAPRGSSSSALPSDAANDSTQQLEEVRGRIRGVEEENRRRVTEAQNQLVDVRATLGPLHPTVVSLNEKIVQLSAPPPELANLRARERELVAKVAKGIEAPPEPTPRASTPLAPAAAPVPASDAVATPTRSADRTSSLDVDDPPTALARSKLQAASAKYNELLSRIEAANIELEATRASFKYQYTMIRPPEVARRPSKPNVSLLMMGSFLLALILMVLVPAGLDLVRGRFVEAWQVERRLKLPVLGELLPPL